LVDGGRRPRLHEGRRVTFGTNANAGVCIHFRAKVPSPLRRQGYSALTVTVEDLEGLTEGLPAHDAERPLAPATRASPVQTSTLGITGTPARVGAHGNDGRGGCTALVPALWKVGSARRTVMAATSTLVRYEDPMEVRERGAVAGFLAGYSSNTAPRLHDRPAPVRRLVRLQPASPARGRRAHLETFARTMEQDGRMHSTVARRLSTLCSFYRYCHHGGFLARDPAANGRRPKVDPESRTLVLDRNELGALPRPGGLGSPRDHALISLAGHERPANQ
jgi:hypothetical protein